MLLPFVAAGGLWAWAWFDTYDDAVPMHDLDYDTTAGAYVEAHAFVTVFECAGLSGESVYFFNETGRPERPPCEAERDHRRAVLIAGEVLLAAAATLTVGFAAANDVPPARAGFALVLAT